MVKIEEKYLKIPTNVVRDKYSQVAFLIVEEDPVIENKKIIHVLNSFPLKDMLKERGYKFNPVLKSWDKEFPSTSLIEEEQRFLFDKGVAIAREDKAFFFY